MFLVLIFMILNGGSWFYDKQKLYNSRKFYRGCYFSAFT
jgi:hypothetical protein